MLNFKQYLNEAANKSLARLHTLVHKNNDPIAILTAFRGENTYEENVINNKKLINDIRVLGWGYTPVSGGYVEKVRDTNGDYTGEKRKIDSEEAFFTVARDTSPNEFDKHLIHLLKHYKQEAAVVIYPGDDQAYMFSMNGSKSALGKWSGNKFADYYTRMKHQPDRIFSFEVKDE